MEVKFNNLVDENGNRSNGIISTQQDTANGLQPNALYSKPSYTQDGGTNTFLNNENWNAVQINEFVTGIWLDELENGTAQPYLDYVDRVIEIPKQKGTLVGTVHRKRPLGLVIEPLAEGEEGHKLVGGAEKVSFTCARYGAYIEVTDVEMMLNPFEMLQNYAQDLIKNAKESLNIIAREVLYMSSQQAFVDSYTSVDEMTKAIVAGTAIRGLTKDDFTNIELQFKEDAVKPRGDAGGKYLVLMDFEGLTQLRKDPEFDKWMVPNTLSPYNQSDLGNGFIDFEDFRIIEVDSLAAKRVAMNGAELNVAIFMGAEATAKVGIGGYNSIESIYHGLDSGRRIFNDAATLAYKIQSFGFGVIRQEAVTSLHYPRLADAVRAVPLSAVNARLSGLDEDNKLKLAGIPMLQKTNVNAKGQGLLGNLDLDMKSIWNGEAVYPKVIKSASDYAVEEAAAKNENAISQGVFDARTFDFGENPSYDWDVDTYVGKQVSALLSAIPFLPFSDKNGVRVAGCFDVAIVDTGIFSHVLEPVFNKAGNLAIDTIKVELIHKISGVATALTINLKGGVTPKQDIKLHASNLSVNVGAEGSVAIDNASDLGTITAVSADTSKATVTVGADGAIKVKGVAAGTVKITVSATNGKASVDLNVTVSEPTQAK